MKGQDLIFSSAYAMRQLILNKKISALELTDFFYERIDAFDSSLNAFLFVDKEDARNYAKEVDRLVAIGKTEKPLLGIPSVVPDVLHMKNTPTTFGSLVFKDSLYDHDEIEIGILKNAGSVILGKTNVAEFGLSYDTENKLKGPTVNPWNREYSAGGGAAGGAVAVSAGLTPFALGTDFNGALRMSSSFCGVVGLIPTRGRVPTVRTHLLPFTEQMFYRKGVIARHVIDIALMLNVLATHDPRDPLCERGSHRDYVQSVKFDTLENLKIGWCEDSSFIPVEKSVHEKVAEGVKNLEKLGHLIKSIQIPFSEDVLTHFQNLFTADRYVLIMKYMLEHPDSFNLLSDNVKRWLRVGNDVTGPQYSMAITYLGILEEMIDHYFKEYDFLLVPSMPIAPFKFGKPPVSIGGEAIKPYIGLCGFLVPFNMSGHPAITLPCGRSPKGLPIGMQLIGRKFSERQLLILARQYELNYSFNI